MRWCEWEAPSLRPAKGEIFFKFWNLFLNDTVVRRVRCSPSAVGAGQFVLPVSCEEFVWFRDNSHLTSYPMADSGMLLEGSIGQSPSRGFGMAYLVYDGFLLMA